MFEAISEHAHFHNDIISIFTKGEGCCMITIMPPSSNTEANAVTEAGLTILDRNVSIVLPDADHTASRKAGISSWTERLHRLHGTSIIFESSKLLSLGASTYATACTIFHRFFQQSSLHEYDVWSVAVASILLATKVEEEPHTLKSIIQAFCHLWRKRLLVTSPPLDETDGLATWNWEHPLLCCLKEAKEMSVDDKESRLQQLLLPMKLGPVYKDWHEQAFNMEAALLRQLGFTLYWIPDSHPHKFILYFCQALGLTDPKFSQRAWNYCNDSCRLDLCVRFCAEIVASSSVLLAARDFSLDLPMSPQPWWEVFVGNQKTNEIVAAANAILGLCQLNKEREGEAFADSMVASQGFIKSLVHPKEESLSGSFNDPGSFLWEEFESAVSGI